MDAMGIRICGYNLSRTPYEEGNWKFVSRLLKPGMTFFDVGANQGFYTILASKRVGPQGRVFAFEPATTELRKLRTNLLLNRCHNVVVEPQAVANHQGVTDFYLCVDYQSSFSSLRQPAEDVTSRTRLMRVPITTLDLYVESNNISSLDFIKIDVEGAELDVLKGAVTVVKEFRPVIMCEIEDRRTRQYGYQAQEILEFLHDCGYKWLSVSRNGTTENCVHKKNYSWENLVAAPKDRLSEAEAFMEEVC